MEKLERNCPKCGKTLTYTNKNNLRSAIKKNSLCRNCKGGDKFRFCPGCGVKLTYKSVAALWTAKNKNTLCRKCTWNTDKAKEVSRNNINSFRQSRGGFIGENNPFFGKTHSIEVKEILSNFFANEYTWTDAQKEQAKLQLAQVANTRPIYDIWLEKYGKEEADRRLQSFKDKQSENNSGERNAMFGKPAPQGSGNGWSGWYKDWFFRSLRELSFMINVIEKENFIWQTPNKDFKIKYQDYDGQERNYFPDFIINNNRLVEIKPARLHNTPKVLAKKIAAENFCKNNSMSYELIDPPILSDKEISDLYADGKIQFLDRYEEKFKERYLL